MSKKDEEIIVGGFRQHFEAGIIEPDINKYYIKLDKKAQNGKYAFTVRIEDGQIALGLFRMKSEKMKGEITETECFPFSQCLILSTMRHDHNVHTYCTGIWSESKP